MEVCATAYVWQPVDSMQELLFSLYYMGHGRWTQVIRLSGECIY